MSRAGSALTGYACGSQVGRTDRLEGIATCPNIGRFRMVFSEARLGYSAIYRAGKDINRVRTFAIGETDSRMLVSDG